MKKFIPGYNWGREARCMSSHPQSDDSFWICNPKFWHEGTNAMLYGD